MRPSGEAGGVPVRMRLLPARSWMSGEVRSDRREMSTFLYVRLLRKVVMSRPFSCSSR